MWICKNFQEVIDSIEHINRTTNAHDTESFDFSTLYTNFEHSSLISNLNWCFDKAFQDHNRKFVTFSSPYSKFSYFSSHPTLKFKFDIGDSKILNSWIIRNAYFKCGNIVLIQRIGIPIGADPAPYQADLGLHKPEFVFIETLLRQKRWNEARTFNHVHRYIDDTNPKNNFGNFAKFKDSIYPPGLIVNKENSGQSSTSMLEIDISIDPSSHKFVTKLYDKRNDFGFPIVKFPHMSSNIHSKTVYDTFVTQVIRYSRVCNNLTYFLFELKPLYSTMVNKGCKKHILLKKLFKTLAGKNFGKNFNISKDKNLLHTCLPRYLNYND